MKSDGFGKHKWFLLAVAFLGINFYGVMRQLRSQHLSGNQRRVA